MTCFCGEWDVNLSSITRFIVYFFDVQSSRVYKRKGLKTKALGYYAAFVVLRCVQPFRYNTDV